jgi:hypothetical protein
MCTKVPYANRWLARQALKALRASGWTVRSVHPCLETTLAAGTSRASRDAAGEAASPSALDHRAFAAVRRP